MLAFRSSAFYFCISQLIQSSEISQSLVFDLCLLLRYKACAGSISLEREVSLLDVLALRVADFQLDFREY